MVDGAGALRGMVSRKTLIRTLQEKGGSTPVLEFMTRDVPTVPENACLDNVYQQLQRSRASASSASSTASALLGYITAENLAELVMIQSSRAARAAQAA